jgi:PmbA protein
VDESNRSLQRDHAPVTDRMPAALARASGGRGGERLFDYDRAALDDLVDDVLGRARSLGATAAAAEVSESSGYSVTVRKGRLETIEQTRDKGLGITIFVGHRRGHASTSDFGNDALERSVQAAYDIARITGEDPLAGLPDGDRLARDPRDPGLFDPWHLPVDQAVEIALAMEKAAFDTSAMIRNSDGASVSLHHGHFVLGNSLGFRGGYPFSRHTIGCSPIASRGRAMQRDDWYSSARAAEDLADPASVGRYAAERALARLGARKLSTRRVPVLFEAPLASGLLGAFVQATSGGALYRKATFLYDSLGKPVFDSHIDIDEDPDVPGGFGSSPFDEEGVATSSRKVVEAGVVKGYFLSTYTGRKLGMPTTGNAGGSHNLQWTSRRTDPGDDLPAMLRKMGTGLLVTELMGQGVNYVTGDYSRGASGFWVENGRISYPVEEITIAGNMAEMFRRIVAIGADTIVRGTRTTGSVLIESMAVAG